MHVRLARRVGGDCLTVVRRDSLPALLLVLLFASFVPMVSCVRQSARLDRIDVQWKMTPASPVVGTSALGEVTLRDAGRRPVRRARLVVEGHMTHPGMAPVIATATEREAGVYEVHLEFTMRGEWILLVTGELPDGRKLRQQLDVANARPEG
jgi:hypothetical protein